MSRRTSRRPREVCTPKPRRVLPRKQKVDKGESAEAKEQAKHELSEAEAKTFKQEVLSGIQKMMLSGVETEMVTWLKDRSCEVFQLLP